MNLKVEVLLKKQVHSIAAEYVMRLLPIFESTAKLPTKASKKQFSLMSASTVHHKLAKHATA